MCFSVLHSFMYIRTPPFQYLYFSIRVTVTGNGLSVCMGCSLRGPAYTFLLNDGCMDALVPIEAKYAVCAVLVNYRAHETIAWGALAM